MPDRTIATAAVGNDGCSMMMMTMTMRRRNLSPDMAIKKRARSTSR